MPRQYGSRPVLGLDAVMTKKPSGLGHPCYLVSDSAPDDDDNKSAHRRPPSRRASRQSPRSRTPRPSPSTSLLALLASFVTPTITLAHAAPPPVLSNAHRTYPSPDTIPTPIHLDFLYPPFRPKQQQLPQAPPHPSEEQEELPAPRWRLRKQRAAASVTSDCGCVIPIKFEENDTGWMVAERWTLHGKSHGNTLAVHIPVPTLHPPIMDTTNIPVDLPTGWDPTTSGRNATYDPIIVTVFAIILACGITGAIAATVWRNQHLLTKKSKEDLEQATKPKRPRTTEDVDSEDSDASTEDEEKPRERMKRKRRRRNAGSGGSAVPRGAGKSSSTFWRPSSRFVGRLRFRSRRPKPAEVSTTEPPIATSRPVSPQPDPPAREDLANPPVILVTAEPEQDSPSHVHSRHPSHLSLCLSPTVHEEPNTLETQSEPERIPASPGPPLPVSSPVSSIHSTHFIANTNEDATVQPSSPMVEGYTSNPPAYIRAGRSWTPRRAEKAPLPGLEAEYDERDLERWRASRLIASSSSTSPRRKSIARSAVAPELGRVRGVHIATDDKAELARLHSFADQPGATLPPTEVLPNTDAPTVPDFGVVDDWYTESQLEQVSSLDQPPSPTLPVPIHSRLPLPPPPEPSLLPRHSPHYDSHDHDTSYQDTHDMNQAYTFRRVWGRVNPSVGPSAPPKEMEENTLSRGLERVQHLEELTPSAPPLLDDPISGAHLPSAPTLWDEDESREPAPGSVPPPDASTESPLDEQSESRSGSSGEDAGAHPDVRVRWVQQRRVEMEGLGLPKYEP